MTRYTNLGGNSAITAYEIGINSITVEFNTGATYLYNYHSAGSTNIEQMKNLAIGGQGLNSFISRVVKKLYAAKLR